MWTVFWTFYDPPLWSILLNKFYVKIWTSGKPPSPAMSTRFMGDPENKETTCDHRVKVYAFENALPLRSNDKKAKMTQKSGIRTRRFLPPFSDGWRSLALFFLCVIRSNGVSRKNSLLTTILGSPPVLREKKKGWRRLMLKAPNGPGHKDGLDWGADGQLFQKAGPFKCTVWPD